MHERIRDGIILASLMGAAFCGLLSDKLAFNLTAGAVLVGFSVPLWLRIIIWQPDE